MKPLAVLIFAAAVAGCASATPSPATAPPATGLSATAPSATPSSVVPAEFRAACGHPGAQVEVRKVPVTISHAACDLTGVAISYKDFGGATVPHGGGGTGIGNSNGFELTVHSGSLDVTITAPATHGNA
jgi:hypothetical protein